MRPARAESWPERRPDGRRIPLQIGDNLELNDNRCVVVGICRVTQTFQNNPVIYTTYSRATTSRRTQRKMLSFVSAKAKAGAATLALFARELIHRPQGLHACGIQEADLLVLPEIHRDADQFPHGGDARIHRGHRHIRVKHSTISLSITFVISERSKRWAQPIASCCK